MGRGVCEAVVADEPDQYTGKDEQDTSGREKREPEDSVREPRHGAVNVALNVLECSGIFCYIFQKKNIRKLIIFLAQKRYVE